MKLSNIFKRDTKAKAKANIQTLDKKQLEKVAGGIEIDSTSNQRVVSPMAGGGR